MESIIGIDLVWLIKAVGLIGIFGIIFAESGLLIGLFLPGDSLLFTAGFLASAGFFDIWTLSALAFAGAVLGDSVGYTFGFRMGPLLFKKESSVFFNKEHLERAARFYEKHGGRTIVLARFIPIIRTFAPIVAGAGRMRYKEFLFYNIVGGFIWAVGMPFAGYWLGSMIPDIDKYLLPIIALIIIASIIPAFVPIVKNRESRAQVKKAVAALYRRVFFRKSEI